MKRVLILIFAFLLFSGCMIDRQELLDSLVTPIPETEAAITPFLTQAPTPTLPPHSAFYIPNLSVEDVIVYFNEVCLDAEFVNLGDPSKLQKWTSPIRFKVFGEPTEQDREVLNSFVEYLNGIYGFPGISEVDDVFDANLRIYFTDEPTMVELMGEQYYGMDGCVTFWYDADMIYDGIICYRNDIDQTVRNSVILEEIYNCLGPVQDSSLRTDSIIYAGYSAPQELTQVDELLLRLLYHPELVCGMNAEQCEAVIRSLYY